MESFLTFAGLALTSALSFSLALLLGWVTLACLLRLLPACAPVTHPAGQTVLPIREAAAVPSANRDHRRVRVVVTNARNHSGKVYAIRVA
jgi:hypothetical protein